MDTLMNRVNDTPRQTAILLLAHGTPDRLSEMAEYLKNVTGGRALPDAVVQELQHRYAEIGLKDEPLPERPQLEDRPPLTRWTLLQGSLLQQQLAALAAAESAPAATKVYVGMRNWHPYIADTVTQMRADGITHIKAICLAPQNSRTSVGLYRRALLAAAPDMQIDFVAGWAEHPLLALAFAEKMWPVWAEACAIVGERVPILFTAHSVPCRTIMTGSISNPASPSARPGAPVPAEGIQDYGDSTAPDPYPVECKNTARAIAECLRPVGLTEGGWYFAFQSQGVAGAPWIGPSVEDTLKAIAAEGHKGVVFQPVGFLCDHVEILYDIDIAFKETAQELGLQLWRAESLNDSETLARALKTIATGTYKAQVDESIPSTT
jgi:protoporphyrin/coproporphyrin ferrochelatase